MKIMLVDDNAEMRQMLRGILAHQDGEFIECSDGAEACRAYPKHHPDWVLMDIQMKPMNGLDAASLLAKRFPASRVMMVTNYASPQFQKAAKKAGARGLISKENLLELRQLLTQPAAAPAKSVSGSRVDPKP